MLHAREQAASHKQWRPLSAFTLNAWLDGWLEEALLRGYLPADDVPNGMLNSAQERLLWERVIGTSLSGLDAAPLFDKSGLAAAAQEANRILIEWNISLGDGDFAEETRQFLVWQDRFQQLCKQNGWLEAVRYFRWQLQCLERGVGEVPEEVWLAGFDRLSPLQKRLVDALCARGAKVMEHRLGFSQMQEAFRVELNDREAECRAAVEWARCKLEQAPDSRLAIVVPELNALRETLAMLLDEAFHPETLTPKLVESTRTYNFSLGVPLSEKAIVASGLDLLRFAVQRKEVPQVEISALLTSPYWSSSYSDADAFARLDARMREKLPLSVTPYRFRQFVESVARENPSSLIAKLSEDLGNLLRLGQEQLGQALPSNWAAWFKDMLTAARWPGERSISSHEYQAKQSFLDVLKSLGDLDSMLGKIPATDAVSRLARLCRERIFQPETVGLPRLQVLGMLEAAAEPLDAMWVMGMNDHVWPPLPNPNPLLPARVQRAVGTPNADSRVQMEFAMQIHHRLLHSAREIVFSSAQKDGERLLRVSPLLHDLPFVSGDVAIFSTLSETLSINAPRNLCLIDDSVAPPVKEGEQVSGGTGLLKAQAICPAWAFYQYRLHAKALKEPVNGLDAMERGTLVHYVLERFWEGRHSSTVREMSQSELERAVMEAVDQALTSFNQHRDAALSPAHTKLEHERLFRLVLTWLQEVELQRDQDFDVIAREQEERITIEGVSIRLILDRIDKLDDGRLVLLDYKTSRHNEYRNWSEVRITEPQLPIYAAFVLEDQDVSAVCFARVRLDDLGFAGVSRDEDVISGAVPMNSKKGRKLFPESDFPDWRSVIAHWKVSIENIARELKRGDAAVRVTDERKLTYCEVLPILRLPERLLQYERVELMERLREQSVGGRS